MATWTSCEYSSLWNAFRFNVLLPSGQIDIISQFILVAVHVHV